MNSRELLIAMAMHYNGDVLAMINAINRKEFISEEEVEGHLKNLKSNALTILDPEYPDYLKHLYMPPIVLFYYGDISLISNLNNNIAVVGSRNASLEGKQNIDYIVSNIAKYYNVVSGLALGIDTVAHQAALYSGGKTIAVLANGIEYCYPSANSELYKQIKKHNLVISEYYGYISPKGNHFHQRNRLIAAFSKGTIIGEASRISGTLITVNYTLQLNRHLMVVPNGKLHNSLNNLLIKEGADVITEPNDVFEYLDDEGKSLLCEVK